MYTFKGADLQICTPGLEHPLTLACGHEPGPLPPLEPVFVFVGWDVAAMPWLKPAQSRPRRAKPFRATGTKRTRRRLRRGHCIGLGRRRCRDRSNCFCAAWFE